MNIVKATSVVQKTAATIAMTIVFKVEKPEAARINNDW